MERDLSLDNILTDEDISSLFEADNIEETSSDETDDNKTKEDNETTEVNVEELFAEPESVGRENNNNEEQEKGQSKWRYGNGSFNIPVSLKLLKKKSIN